VEEALERVANLLLDLDWIRNHSAPAEKLSASLAEFETYIRNNQEYIPNYGELYRQGETISTAFVESTIHQVVSRRFVKKQQMQRTLRGAHLLLQTRTKVLNDELDDVFRRWYARFRHNRKPPRQNGKWLDSRVAAALRTTRQPNWVSDRGPEPKRPRYPNDFFSRFRASIIFVMLARISCSDARAHRSLASAEATAFFLRRFRGPPPCPSRFSRPCGTLRGA
jgi:hypothetical protein